MISYAYNREDVLLERLFRDQENGFYIDVGAGHPTQGSLTRHFYDRGWRGLNVEPSASLFDSLCSERPEDNNLRLAISNRSGWVNLYEFSGQEWGLSTLSAEQAEFHAQSGLQYETCSVRAATLAEICEEKVTGDIQFLSIDVEGHEAKVVEGGDWDRWRPRVVVIESTRPMTQIPTHQVWEPRLLQADYLFTYFDGLNRFYVRAEDVHLMECFKTPVNLFDSYIPYEAKRKVTEIQSQLAAERAQNQDLRRSESVLLAENQRLRESLERLEG
jgi:FkbM family methyltransferase